MVWPETDDNLNGFAKLTSHPREMENIELEQTTARVVAARVLATALITHNNKTISNIFKGQEVWTLAPKASLNTSLSHLSLNRLIYFWVCFKEEQQDKFNHTKWRGPLDFPSWKARKPASWHGTKLLGPSLLPHCEGIRWCLRSPKLKSQTLTYF